jgi:hypothetical protein
MRHGCGLDCNLRGVVRPGRSGRRARPCRHLTLRVRYRNSPSWDDLKTFYDLLCMRSELRTGTKTGKKEGKPDMGHRGKLSEFEAYLKDRQDKTFRSKSEIERNGTQAVLDRCRSLALRIQSELSSKNPDDFADLLALADFQVSIERAASVLERSKEEQ